MKKDENIGFFTKILLKVVTFFQEAALKQQNSDFYYKLTKFHFKVYFGKDLVEEALNNSDEFKRAADRHGAMVALNVWSHSSKKIQKDAYEVAKEVFLKNLLLEAPL